MIVSAFAPGSIGNVGPGFDVLGLAVEGIGDRVSLELTRGEPEVISVTGVDADLVPREPLKNAAVIAAIAWLRSHGDDRNPVIQLQKGLRLAGGLGGSVASAVAGAFAARLAVMSDNGPSRADVIAAAFVAESNVAGRHLDNIAASVLGGLTISRSIDPLDAISIPVMSDWWITLATPEVRVETKHARSILPETLPQKAWVQQMANTAAIVHAFATGNGELLARALDDGYAEPLRAPLIPHFYDVKRSALDAGAFGCSISGSGPTIFAIAPDEPVARNAGEAMKKAFRETQTTVHVGRVARQGVRAA